MLSVWSGFEHDGTDESDVHVPLPSYDPEEQQTSPPSPDHFVLHAASGFYRTILLYSMHKSTHAFQHFVDLTFFKVKWEYMCLI